MGYNKRYLNKEVINTILREDGIQSLIRYISKPNTLIMEDEYSQKVCDIILKRQEDDDILNKILELNYGTD